MDHNMFSAVHILWQAHFVTYKELPEFLGILSTQPMSLAFTFHSIRRKTRGREGVEPLRHRHTEEGK